MHGWDRDFQPCVYLLASRRKGTLYVGVTSNIARRAFEHREGLIAGFTRRYGVKMLVHYEFFATMPDAIRREKQVKEWQRAWKIRSIEELNPDWQDLYDGLVV